MQSLENGGGSRPKNEDARSTKKFAALEMSCSSSSADGKRGANVVLAAISEVQAKTQGVREGASSNLSDGNVGSVFVIALYRNFWD